MLIHLHIPRGHFHSTVQSCIVVTDTMRPAKSKIFIIWSFTENVCQSRFQGVKSLCWKLLHSPGLGCQSGGTLRTWAPGSKCTPARLPRSCRPQWKGWGAEYCHSVGFGHNEAVEEVSWGTKNKKEDKAVSGDSKKPTVLSQQTCFLTWFRNFPAWLASDGMMSLSPGQGPISKRAGPASRTLP